MGAISLGCLQISSFIGGSYSQRRHVIDASSGRPRPIISFSTQYIPVLTALAQAYVMEAFGREARTIFVSMKGRMYDQHFAAATFKAGMVKLATSMPVVLGDRCGAQGLFSINQLSTLFVSRFNQSLFGHVLIFHPQADFRGAGIAEGDILTISIRMFHSI